MYLMKDFQSNGLGMAAITDLLQILNDLSIFLQNTQFYARKRNISWNTVFIFVDYINVNVSITICRCVLLQNIFRAVTTSSLRT